MLKTIPQLKYTYRLLICPELYGPMFWLDEHCANPDNILGAILLKSVGNASNLKIQTSFNADSILDYSVRQATNDCCNGDVEMFPFRTCYGNDEVVFESPGFEIPSVTLTRYPFLEYHTNLDTPEKIDYQCIFETLKVLINTIEILETNSTFHSPPPGLFCLSNPKYDLYRTAIEPGISKAGSTSVEKSWNLMMNCLPRLLLDGVTPLQLAMNFNLNYKLVHDYLVMWVEKGLAKVGVEQID